MIKVENSDDKKYMALIGKYKTARLSNPKDANKYLKAAMALKKRGNVSEDVVLGSGYL